MNKLLIPTPSRGIDLGWELFEFLMGTSTITGGIHEVMQNLARAYGDNYIIYGCGVSGVNVSAGLVMLAGELLVVDAHTKSGDYFVKVTTNETTWSIQDLDGNTQNVLKKNRATLTAGSGTLAYNGLALKDVMLTKLGYGIKRIEIGTWDMDSTVSVNVSHGLTDAQIVKIVMIQAFITPDDLTDNWPLSHYNANDNLIDGGIPSIFSSTGITPSTVFLTRRTGGHFDSVSFNSTAINRGYINIFYLL